MKKPRKPLFTDIPHLDCRGDYPNANIKLADRLYQHPFHYQPIGLTDVCRDLNEPGNLTRALLHLQKNYETDKRTLQPETILVYNFGLTLVARTEL